MFVLAQDAKKLNAVSNCSFYYLTPLFYKIVRPYMGFRDSSCDDCARFRGRAFRFVSELGGFRYFKSVKFFIAVMEVAEVGPTVGASLEHRLVVNACPTHNI